MLQITSSKERLYWRYALIVLFAIFASIFIGRPLLNRLTEETVTIGFWIGLFLVIVTTVLNGLKTKKHPLEIITYLGIFAVYLLILISMAIPTERSHLIEYSVLAVFVFEALKERSKYVKLLIHAAPLAVMICTLIGVLDEVIQLFVPGRICDWFDMLFNFIAATLAVVGGVIIIWVRKKVTKKSA